MTLDRIQKSYFLLLVILLGSTKESISQISTFTLVGKINIDEGRIELFSELPDKYDTNNKKYSANITNGNFIITGCQSSYAPYYLRIGNEYLSGLFFIEPGTQRVECSIDSIRCTPKIQNAATNEYFMFKHIMNPTIDSIRKLRSYESLFTYESDSIRHVDIINRIDSINFRINELYISSWKRYIHLYPNSKIMLPMLILSLDFFEAQTISNIYTYFPEKIKHSEIGHKLQIDLINYNLLNIGNFFPNISLLDTSLNSYTYHNNSTTCKYTLIDLWYSNCAPCIGQFNSLIELLNNSTAHKLNIVGISTDKGNDILKWKKIINKYNLPWVNYIDTSKTINNIYNIRTFPTNFLLDENGKIIAKNISLNILENYIK